MQATPTAPPRHRLSGEALGALRRGQAVAMHVRGTLRTAVAGPAQAIDAGHKGGSMGALVVTRHWTTYAMRAGHAPSPMYGHIDLCTVLVPIDGDALHQHTHDLLAVLRGCCRGVPQGWDVVRHAQDRLPLHGTSTPGDARVGTAHTPLGGVARDRAPLPSAAPAHGRRDGLRARRLRTVGPPAGHGSALAQAAGAQGPLSAHVQRAAPALPPHATLTTPAGAPACSAWRHSAPGTLRRS